MTPRKPSKSSLLTENPDSSRTPRPNSRSSEVGDPMRKSFSGNPFQKPSIVANPRGSIPVTPANSPSDWAVRGRESNTMRFLRESEEKENARDSNNQRRPAAKSPSITNSKGIKNFMSPTISAASKINASPSKKILTERNSHEQTPLRSSVTSLDLRSSCSSVCNLSETLEESETRFDKELDLKDPDKVAVQNPTVGTADSLPGSDNIVEDMKPSFPSALEPIDADPLTPMPPYDPKTNFLAPRPKFLYYKPKEMNSDPLDGDDGFFSDSSSESEAAEEDAASSQVVVAKEEEEEEEEEAAADTEPNLHQSPGIEKEAMTVVKERSRQHLFTKSKCIISAFILLLIACSTMMETDHLQIARSYNSMIKESSFPVVLEVVSKKTECLRSSVGGNLRLWCHISVSYIGGLMSELRGEHRHGHVNFFNLTNLEETQWNDEKMENLIKDDDSEMSKIFEQEVVQIEAEEEEESGPDSRIEAEVEVDVEEGAGYDEISSVVLELDDSENSSCADAEEVKSVEEAVEVIAAVEEEKILEEPELVTVQSGEVEDEEEEAVEAAVEVIAVEEEKILEEPELVTVQSGEVEDEVEVAVEVIALEEEKILEEPELVTIQSGEVEDEVIFSVEESESVVAAELQSELPQVEEEVIPTDIKIASQESAETGVPESTESSSSRLEEGESNFLRMTQIAALSSVLLSLVAAGFVALKKIRSSSMVVVSNAAQAAEQGEEEHIDFMGAKKFNISPVYGNNLMADFDFVGDSSWSSEIPLEDHKVLKKQSGDLLVNPWKSSSRRRESLAASSSSSPDMSMGGSASPSISYGSFTTYEMIPIKKKRNGDEELVITPLRRSSRLRK